MANSNNPPAFPLTCKWCSGPAYIKQGHIHLCKKHYRFSTMRANAKRHHKSVPTYQQLEDLFEQTGLQCQHCKRSLNYLSKEGPATVITLQHDDSGDFKFLCLSCNTAHARSARDLMYSIKDDEKFCKSCKSVLPTSCFYSDRYKRSGLKSCCKNCSDGRASDWRNKNQKHYNEYQRNRRAACKG